MMLVEVFTETPAPLRGFFFFFFKREREREREKKKKTGELFRFLSIALCFLSLPLFSPSVKKKNSSLSLTGVRNTRSTRK